MTDQQGGHEPSKLDPWTPPDSPAAGTATDAPPAQGAPAAIPAPTGPGTVPPPPAAPGHSPAGPYGPPVPVAPAGLPGNNAYGAWTPQPGQAVYPYPMAGGPAGPPPQNGKGLTAMVLGLSALSSFYLYGVAGIILGTLAVVFGVIGSRKAKRGEADNAGQARIGIITGAIGLVLGALTLALIITFWDELTEDDDEYGDSNRYSYSLAHTPRPLG
ncbi:DUF4190 domain-containing protein [Streptomyces qinzhouensis]|uniref:DUF4190 domain-containing protein n=1 Tax=Streptomyces qinzhouensis TaxID=2599401 RepID=A0A5B8J886_9ACTN|nr:DUF4190 domain-containing protein [Streptomyces qinzhouensis]QDY76101.1 DUF4190 domain-containing protein [Streptomyces qinzhouensis]